MATAKPKMTDYKKPMDFGSVKKTERLRDSNSATAKGFCLAKQKDSGLVILMDLLMHWQKDYDSDLSSD